ncbi:hypothetical protein SH501x_000919 [Pirellulaceae bacterium SH501]
MPETLSCPNCGHTLHSIKTVDLPDDKSVSCNSCKTKSHLGQWRKRDDERTQLQVHSASAPLPPALPAATAQLNHILSAKPDVFNARSVIALWIAATGLSLLCLSPFLKWVILGAGGITGLAGDGKIMLAISVIAVIAFVVYLVQRKHALGLLLPVQAWGLFASIWMSTILWRMSIATRTLESEGSPFAGFLAAVMISPGEGLYLGLIGGICLAGSLGFLVATSLKGNGKLAIFVGVESLLILLGISGTYLLGLPSPSTHQGNPHDMALPDQEKEIDAISAEFKKPFTLGNLRITPVGIEVKRLNNHRLFGESQQRNTESIVITFIAKNVSDGQVFSAFSMLKATDNFGNSCKDPTDSGLSYDSAQIEANELTKDLQPGESARVMLAFDPKNPSASEYICLVRTQVSNSGDYKSWKLRFPAPK